MKIKNVYAHWKKIRTHRKWVRHYCFKAGLYWQGLIHDFSKYSPTEFWESVKYYQGSSTPIVACKADKGYSMAWFHHRGRNRHHYEYWMDNFDKGGEPILMPYKYFAEQVCDFLGAARAYMGNKFSFAGEYEWWQKRRIHCAMNPKNIAMLDILLWDFKRSEETGYVEVETLLKENVIKKVYEANK